MRRGLFTALTLVALLTVARPSDATEPPAGPAVTDLPLVEVPANGDLGLLAVYLTGDGGYHGTDKGIAQGLASAGIPVAALNTRKYFGMARSPESAAEDLARILRHYLDAWHARQFITIGYSYGANVMPYLLTRLPQDLRTRLRAVVLVSPTEWADFHFHITEWLGVSHSTRYPVTPELERLHGTQVLCFYGASDGETIGPRLDPSLVTKTEIPGGHLVGRSTQLIVEKIVETIRDHSISAVPLTPGRRAKAPCVGSISGGDSETSAALGADRAAAVSGAARRKVATVRQSAKPRDVRRDRASLAGAEA